ncbi:MAG: hypothetical protein JWR27_2395 [Aeromicrobium sp.]|jgi:hypothetical protein|nr:hypothetical protein [Aeromicrobium sp.]
MFRISRPLVVVAAMLVIAVSATNPAQATEGPTSAPSTSSTGR